jgi:hypothetical protein
MNKKMINKQFFASVSDVPEVFPPEFITESKDAVVLRFQYKGFIMYYPVSKQTANGKTKAQLFKMFISDFVKGYNEFIATQESEGGLA